jgi:methyl coenzyme M reductase gamma subunit
MYNLSKAVGVGFLSLVCCLALSTAALSLDTEVYDKPDIQHVGKTLHGKVVKIDERDANLQRWDVSVKSGETGEVIVLHLDKTTIRKDRQMDPVLGDNVIVKYDEKNKHAISFLTDASMSH